MCGIAGYIQRETSSPATIAAMLDRIAHRGPDAVGTCRSRTPDNAWEIVLGHRRLSIVDLAGSPQPMADASGTHHLTYNGELYNFAALRTGLQQRGRTFATAGDTEVVLQHLAATGVGGLIDFNGMFALGLWDAGAESLLLARDRAGIKPLYWARLSCGGIAFASELLALAAHPGVGREMNDDAVAEFMFRDYVLPPNTILRNVYKLLPGQWLRWTARNAAVETGIYWQPQTAAREADANADRLNDLLQSAVRSQLMADVPVGVFLSGGLDSSLVAALATAAAGPVTTFSLGFEDASFDESSSAQAVAEHIKSKHHRRVVTDAVLLDSLDQALGALDEPMGDHSILPTYLLSQLAAAHVKVALGGDGADELFGGYPTYLAHKAAAIYGAVPGPARRLLEPAISAVPASNRYMSLGWKMKRFALRWDDIPAARHQRWMSATDLPALRALLPGENVRLLAGDGTDGLNAVMRFDFRTYLPASVLTKVDRSSMAHGLEVRPPFLDNAVIDFAMALPASQKVRGRTTKWLLKQAAGRWLPPSIIHRKKHGFSVPLARWIRGPLRQEAEAAIDDALPPFDRAMARRMLGDHVARKQDHAKTLWALIVLRHWSQNLHRQ